MTGYYEPEINAYEEKIEGSYPLYKINKKKFGSNLFYGDFVNIIPYYKYICQ